MKNRWWEGEEPIVEYTKMEKEVICSCAEALSRGYQVLLWRDTNHVSYLCACVGLGFQSFLTCAALRFFKIFSVTISAYYYVASGCHIEKQLFSCIF